MRIPLILLLLALFAASPVAAQEGASALAVRPLPAALTPASAAPPREVEVAALDRIERGALIGMLVGATAGGLYGGLVREKCDPVEDCYLSPEYRAFVFAVLGASAGGLVGAVTGALMGPGGEGTAVAVTLRH